MFGGVPHRYVGMEAMIRRWRTLGDGQRQKGGSRPAGSRAVGRLGGGEDDFEGSDRAHRASGPCPKKKKSAAVTVVTLFKKEAGRSTGRGGGSLKNEGGHQALETSDTSEDLAEWSRHLAKLTRGSLKFTTE